MTRAARAALRAVLLLAAAMPALAAPPADAGSRAPTTPAPSGLPYAGRNDELFGLMPTGARRPSGTTLRADQQFCDTLARRAGIAADIGNRAGQQDALRQMRDAGCP